MASREFLIPLDNEPRRSPGHTIALIGKESIVAVENTIVNPSSFTPIIPAGGAQRRERNQLVEARAIPYVGGNVHADWRRLNFSTEVGIGMQFPDSDNNLFWGLITPHLVIQSWRAMQLLQEARKIRKGTLAGAWYASGQEIHPSNEEAVAQFAEDIGQERFPLLRGQVLKSMLPTEDLLTMVGKLSLAGIPVDYREYQQEMQSGRMPPEPEVITMYQRNKKLISLHEQEEAEMRRRAPRL